MPDLCKARVLYLYSELMGYNIPVLREFNRYGASSHVISWDKKKQTPYSPPTVEGVTFYKRSDYDWRQLAILAQEINPTIVYISGWQDRGYLYAARQLRKRGVPVVAGFDDQWFGTPRQRIGSILGRRLLPVFFSHAWVAGSPQYEFARRLGFDNDHIVFNLLSADVDLFNTAQEYLDSKARSFPRTFLYVGRLTHVKGTDTLLEAYDRYVERFGGDWPLTCVGNGDLESEVRAHRHVRHIPFTAQHDLARLVKDSGVFILPSRHDPWGVVAHEFAASGMALILSNQIGAASSFLIEGFNGYQFEATSPDDLAGTMVRVSSMSDSELHTFSVNSALLAGRITPRISAAAFLSILSRSRHVGGAGD